jgi:hypothetical protein
MLAMALVFVLAQPQDCGREALAFAEAATRLVDDFDFKTAAGGFELAVLRGCESARVPALYLRGLAAAREAYSQGGADEALIAVRQAAANLESLGGGVAGPAEIARLVLMAAAAAAQSERDEMALYLESALKMEALQLAANQPGAPTITAHEAAGDLWLEVHRFDEARQAYTLALELIGSTPRVNLGLARVAVRLKDAPAACASYRSLVYWWERRRAETALTAAPVASTGQEIPEARAYLAEFCPVRATPSSRP